MVHKPYIILFKSSFLSNARILRNFKRIFVNSFATTIPSKEFLFILRWKSNRFRSSWRSRFDLRTHVLHFVSLLGAFAFWAQLWILLGYYHLAHNKFVSLRISYQAPDFDKSYHKDLAIELACNGSNLLKSNQRSWGCLQQLLNDTCHFRINSLFCWTNISY
jgi:hypothetical protein